MTALIPGRSTAPSWLDSTEQATYLEELAEDSLRDLGMDWQQPADWDEPPRGVAW